MASHIGVIMPRRSDTIVNLDPHRLGRLGEHIAVRHLISLGWTIIDVNWSSEHGEIDIVAHDPENTLVFVEVRTRRGMDAMQRALESVDKQKQERLSLLVDDYVVKKDVDAAIIRQVDVIGVSLEKNGRFKVQLIRDALGW
jgi:putative endonuclease